MNTTYPIDFTFHAMAASGNISGLKMMFEQAGSGHTANIINGHDHRGFTVLHKAMESGETKLVQMLIDLGADINAEVTGTDPEGWTALHLAAFDDHPDIIGLLITHGVEIGHKGKGVNRMTPLRVAVTRDHFESVKKLLALGADPLETDPQGFSLLHEAVNIGNLEIAKELLIAGCDPNIVAKDGSTPLMWATKHDDEVMLFALKSKWT
jgi:uncharacterized protein